MQTNLPEYEVAFEVRDDQFVTARRAAIAPNLADPRSAIRCALEEPRGFPPLRRALTSDDRVAVVIDERLPQLGPMVGELLAYLGEAGIEPTAITLVSAAGSRQEWIDELPDTFQDVRTEIHDPDHRQAVSYLASTRHGRRVYLNRTVVEADQSIVLAGCRYDAALGRHDGAGALFPALSDAQTQRETLGNLSAAAPNGSERALHREATEVAWLLGVPFLVQIVEGSGDGVAHVVGGTVESSAECEQLLDRRWRVAYGRRAQTVVATMTSDPARQSFEALAQAALCASRVVEPSGRIVLLTRGSPRLNEATAVLRDADDPEIALRRLQERRPADLGAALQWVAAVRHANVYLLSELLDETAEDLFATPLQHARQAQRLIDAGGPCLFIDDADKALAVLE